MKQRLYKTVLLIIVIGACILGYKFYQQYQTKQHVDHLRISRILHPQKGNKQKASHFSNNDWLLMGYMAYARHNYEQSRHVKNTAELVNDVKEDLQNGDLSAKKEDDHYLLSNKFGSVKGYVQDNDVKITGDGITVNSKAKLKQGFTKYDKEIREMSLMIK